MRSHRILFRCGHKRHLVDVANRFTMAGLAGIAFSIIGVVTLVSDLLFGTATTVVMTTATAFACALTWYGCPCAAGACCPWPATRRR